MSRASKLLALLGICAALVSVAPASAQPRDLLPVDPGPSIGLRTENSWKSKLLHPLPQLLRSEFKSSNRWTLVDAATWKNPGTGSLGWFMANCVDVPTADTTTTQAQVDHIFAVKDLGKKKKASWKGSDQAFLEWYADQVVRQKVDSYYVGNCSEIASVEFKIMCTDPRYGGLEVFRVTNGGHAFALVTIPGTKHHYIVDGWGAGGGFVGPVTSTKSNTLVDRFGNTPSGPANYGGQINFIGKCTNPHPPYSVPLRPGRPRLKAKTPNSLSLCWPAVAATGGSPISEYRLQQAQAGTSTWTEIYRGSERKFTATAHPYDNGTAVKFKTGQAYKYRVEAKNAVGWSPVGPTKTFGTGEARTFSAPCD